MCSSVTRPRPSAATAPRRSCATSSAPASPTRRAGAMSCSLVAHKLRSWKDGCMSWRHRTLLSLCLIVAALVVAVTARAEEKGRREFRDCSDCPEMVVVPAGKFVMGSPANERGRFDSEGPLHPVSVRAFALGKYDVTSEEFLIFLRETGYQPAPCDPVLGLTWRSPGRGLAYPPGDVQPPRWQAVCLNWFDAEAYIAWLNARVRGRIAPV